MHNSFWKLTSLATVVGAALFFIVQAQKLMKPEAGTSTESTANQVETEEDSEPFGNEEEDFGSSELASESSRKSQQNNLIEPDPFGDENDTGFSTANYGNQRQELAPESDEIPFRTASQQTRRQPLKPERQPTLRLPQEQAESNPFDGGDTLSNEADHVGPRLSLPGKSRANLTIDDDSAEADFDFRDDPSKIRRTSAEEGAAANEQNVPTLGGLEEEDDSDFRAGRSGDDRPLDPSDDGSGPSLAPQLEQTPTRPSPIARFEDDSDLNEAEASASPPKLEPSPVETSDDDDAAFTRGRSDRDYASELTEQPAEDSLGSPARSAKPRYSPDYPEADHPMPDAVAAEAAPQLFRDDSRGRPALSYEDDSELFPETDATESPQLRPQPGRNQQFDRFEQEPSLAATEEAPEDGKPYLSIEKKSPPSATLGQKMVYEIRISNPGNVPARQVVLNDDVPEGVDLDGTIPRAELSGRRLIWRLGTLQPGDEKVVKVRVVPVRVGEVGSVATVNFLSETEVPKNIPANFMLDGKQPLPRVPQLEISSTPLPDTIAINQKFRIALTIKNIDRQTLSGIILVADLAEGIRHQEVPDQQRLESEVDPLKPGESTTIDLDLVGVRPGMAINRLTLWIGDQPVRESELNFRILPR